MLHITFAGVYADFWSAWDSGGSRIWVTGGGGGGRGILRPQNLWSRSDHGEGLPSPPLGGSGGMLPREILKIAMRRYAFFTSLGYNFRKIRERIFKVICTYIHNIYTIFEVTGKIRKIKKKMFNMKKIMHPTVNPATFFLDVYARMPSPLLQNPIVCPCGHTGAAVHSSAPQTSCCGGLTWRIPRPS